jgi:hypothetical protein
VRFCGMQDGSVTSSLTVKSVAGGVGPGSMQRGAPPPPGVQILINRSNVSGAITMTRAQLSVSHSIQSLGHARLTWGSSLAQLGLDGRHAQDASLMWMPHGLSVLPRWPGIWVASIA